MKINKKIISTTLILFAIGILVCVTAIAYRTRAEAIVSNHKRAILGELLNSNDIGVIILSPDDRIVEWSVGAEDIFGWTAEEVLGSKPDFLMSPNSWEKHDKEFDVSAHKKNGGVIAHDVWAFRKDGKAIPLHFTVAQFKDHIGYYSLALIYRQGDYKKLAAQAEPTANIKPCLPQPMKLKFDDYPGIYHPFQ